MSRRTVTLTLVIFTLVVYLGTAFHPGLLDDADAGHAEVAREVLERNDWVTFYMNGIRFLEKAPLLFWCGAIAFKIFGMNAFSIRLTTSLGVLGLVLVGSAFGRKLRDEKTGLYAGLILASSFGIYLYTRIFVPDILLTFCITSALYCFWQGLVDRRYFWGFWAAMAGGVLAKGLIGLFPLGVAGIYILATRRWDLILGVRPAPGTLLFLILAAPWHVIAAVRTPKWAWFYFVNEHFLRYLGKRYPMDYDTVPFLLFWSLNLVWLFPWSVFLPLTCLNLGMERGETDERRSKLLLWIWAGVVMVFFSFSTRQEYYTMPAWPPVALLIADALAQGEDGRQKWLGRFQGFLALAGLAAGAVLALLLWVSRGVVVQGDIATLLTSNPEMYKLSLGHMFDLQAETFAALRFPAASAAVVLSLGFGLAWWLRKSARPLGAVMATAATAGAFFFCAQIALGVFEPYLSSRPLARAIERAWRPGDLVVFNGEYYIGSSIGFYLQPKVYLLNGLMTGLEFGSHYPDAPKIFIGDKDIKEMWRGERRVFLFTEGKNRESLETLFPPGSAHVVAASGGKFVLSNRP